MIEIYKKHRLFDWIYTFIIVVNILFFHVLTDYRMVAKPMIVGSLIAFYIMNVKFQSPILLTALIFALLGDVFLLFDSEPFFLIGLACFGLMQILYSIIFLQHRDIKVSKNKTLYMAIVVVFATIFFSILKPSLGSLAIPVFVYMLLIVIMVCTAILRHNKMSHYMIVVVGALLFLISDALIALGKFLSPIDAHNELVMLTYMVAQFFIIKGIVAHENSLKSPNAVFVE